MKTIEVQAKADHIASLSKAKPVNALCELIWNALDADANNVQVNVSENGLGGIDEIAVVDDGHGLPHGEAITAFGGLGGSWKAHASRSREENRLLHGKEGKGRFRAFALGGSVTWETSYVDEATVHSYQIVGSKLNPLRFSVDDAPSVNKSNDANSGTRVVITGISETFGQLCEGGDGLDRLTEQFALYLREYPSAEIFFRGEKVDPASAEKRSTEYVIETELGGGQTASSTLQVVEWNTKKERRIYLCNSDGFTLKEMKAGIRLPHEHHFTAYLRSEYIEELEKNGLLDLEDLNEGLSKVLEETREKIRGHFREIDRLAAVDVVEEWKTEGSYPYEKDVETEDVLSKARQHVFDICALNAHEYLPDLRKGQTQTRKFTFRVLKQAIESSPESLQYIMGELLDLPESKRDELAEMIKKTSLSAMIAATKLVTQRLDFLQGLEAMLFEDEPKKQTLERSQLHRILADESWIFGERFNLSSDDESLSTVLAKHLAELRPGEEIDHHVTREDGSVAIIDLMGQAIPYPNREEHEYLVVELKRPSQPLNLKVKGQIESYALTVAGDERFDKEKCRWTFLAIGNKFDSNTEQTVRQDGLPRGFFYSKDNVSIGLKTWSELLGENKARHEFFREQLQYNASRDDGVEYLNAAYASYLPESLKQSE